MPSIPTTLAQLQASMVARYDGSRFWTDEEARLAINEALAEWNLLTGHWRTRVTLPVLANNPEVPLPALLTYGMRVTLNSGWPLIPSSLSELDLARPSWRGETIASGGDVPTRPTVWAPISLTRIALWPTAPFNSAVVCDGVLSTPLLVNPLDVVDLGDEIIDILSDQALHVVAFKEAGSRWRATRPFFEAFLQAAAEENSLLKTHQAYRRHAGLDRRRDYQPSTGDPNQMSGVAAQFSRHDQTQQQGG